MRVGPPWDGWRIDRQFGQGDAFVHRGHPFLMYDFEPALLFKAYFYPKVLSGLTVHRFDS